jgi:hypothetical protein
MALTLSLEEKTSSDPRTIWAASSNPVRAISDATPGRAVVGARRSRSPLSATWPEPSSNVMTSCSLARGTGDAEGMPDRCSRAHASALTARERVDADGGRARIRGLLVVGQLAQRRSAATVLSTPRSSCRAPRREHPLAEKRPVIVVAASAANDRSRVCVLRGAVPTRRPNGPPRLGAMAATQCERTIEHGLPAGEPVATAGSPERDGDEAVEQPDPPRFAGRHPPERRRPRRASDSWPTGPDSRVRGAPPGPDRDHGEQAGQLPEMRLQRAPAGSESSSSGRRREIVVHLRPANQH